LPFAGADISVGTGQVRHMWSVLARIIEL
jgi:hypothetical protein